MSTIVFRLDESIKRKLQRLAKYKGINLSALIKLYLTKAMNHDLNEKLENGRTVAEELELLATHEEEDEGVYKNADELIKHLDKLENESKIRQV